MKTLEEITEEYHNTRIWEDGKTLDYELPDEDAKFVNQLIKFRCPSCEGSIIDGNQKVLKGLPVIVKGAQLVCHGCKLSLFIHEPVNS